jgi:ribosome maturation factor RimP
MTLENLYGKKIWSMAEEIANQEGVKLLDVRFLTHGRRRIFQIYIYSPAGISIKDCTSFSKKLSNLLDSEDLFLADYNLEVSSPGLNFTLTKPFHYQIFSGQRVKFVLVNSVEGRKQGKGILKFKDDNQIEIEIDENTKIKTEISNIKKCSLNPEFKF